MSSQRLELQTHALYVGVAVSHEDRHMGPAAPQRRKTRQNSRQEQAAHTPQSCGQSAQVSVPSQT
jgi:hypothetical protein